MPCLRSNRSNDIDIESSFFFCPNTSSLSLVVLLSFLLIVSRCRVSSSRIQSSTVQCYVQESSSTGRTIQDEESSDHKSDLQICSHLVNKRHSKASAHHPSDLQGPKTNHGEIFSSFQGPRPIVDARIARLRCHSDGPPLLACENLS